MVDAILALNAGSSSVKFGVYSLEDGRPALRYRGQAQGLGSSGARLEVRSHEGIVDFSEELAGADLAAAMDGLMNWLERGMQGLALRAVGHRVVHGGTRFTEPVLLDDSVLRTLDGLTPLAPLHQPQNLAPRYWPVSG